MDLFTNNDLYDDDSYAFDADWKIGKKPETDMKKIVFNIDKPETDLKKIEFNINVNNDKIDDMNDDKAVHLNDGLVDDNNTNIEESEVQQKQDDWHNYFCTIVENELQPSHQVEDQNKTNDGELVMAYDKILATRHYTQEYSMHYTLNQITAVLVI